MAYAEDTKGDEIYTVYVIDAESGEYVGQPLKGITSDIEWAGDDHLVYITMEFFGQIKYVTCSSPSYNSYMAHLVLRLQLKLPVTF